MTQPPIIIFGGDAGWRLARGSSVEEISSSIGGTPAQVASEIAAMLGSSVESVTFALPTTWCFSATVSLTGVPIRNRRTSLLYRLELLLPFTAEDIAADCILNEPGSALAICVSTSTIKAFIDAIEAEGILIQAVVPASIIAASSLLASQNAGDLVVCQSGKSVELFNTDRGKLVGWYLFPGEADDLRWHLDQLSTDKTLVRSAIACNIDSTLVDVLKTMTSVRLLAVDDRSVEEVACAAIAAGEPLAVNLRQDGLAPSSALRGIRRPVNEMLIATLLLVACICGAACWRATRLEQLATKNRDQQRTLFLQLYPGHSVPTNIVSRLKSEDRALGNGSANIANSPAISALPVLQSILVGIDSLPPQVRLQVDDLKVDDQTFSLDGILKTRADLTNLVDALQQTSRVKLDPPQTEQIAGKGLHIILNGSLAENEQQK